jgi:di/tricarboxylate transporter
VSSQALYVLIVAGVALLLFVTEWVAPDIVALLVLISLGVGGILDLPALFSGFGSPVVAALIGIFMLTAALQHTGVTAYLSRLILRLTGGLGERPLVGVLTLSAAITSIMMNTVASVALIAPIGRQVAMKRDVSPSRLMMPISYGALLGGMATLLTTSNLLVAGLLSERGLRTFGLLDFLPVGAPIALIGLVYLTLASPLLLPERAPSDQWGGLQFVRQELTRTYRE